MKEGILDAVGLNVSSNGAGPGVEPSGINMKISFVSEIVDNTADLKKETNIGLVRKHIGKPLAL